MPGALPLTGKWLPLSLLLLDQGAFCEMSSRRGRSACLHKRKPLSVMSSRETRVNGLWSDGEGEGCKVWAKRPETDSSASLQSLQKASSQPGSLPSGRPTPQPCSFFNVYPNPSSQTLLEETALVFFSAICHPPHQRKVLSRPDLNLATGEWEMDGGG